MLCLVRRFLRDDNTGSKYDIFNFVGLQDATDLWQTYNLTKLPFKTPLDLGSFRSALYGTICSGRAASLFGPGLDRYDPKDDGVGLASPDKVPRCTRVSREHGCPCV
jgi:hypothetical protein